MNDEMHSKIEERIIANNSGLINEGIEYKGFIFIGLINANGSPYNYIMLEWVILRLKLFYQE